MQSDLLDGLDSKMVIPLRRLKQFPKAKLPALLTPVFILNGEEFLLETPKMAAVPQRVLKSPVTSLAKQQNQITAALDFLFQGY